MKRQDIFTAGSILWVAAIGLAAATLATPSQSQTSNCGEHGAVVERLAKKYGEARQGLGIAQNNGVVEVFASEQSGTWTIVITMPSGRTCLVAAGEAWELVNEPIVKHSEPA